MMKTPSEVVWSAMIDAQSLFKGHQSLGLPYPCEGADADKTNEYFKLSYCRDMFETYKDFTCAREYYAASFWIAMSRIIEYDKQNKPRMDFHR